jgi:Holliday junction resolvase RusA-like endonuclease
MTVIDICEIDIVSINMKFMKGRSGKLFLHPEYRAFKEELAFCCRRVRMKPPYSVTIQIKTGTDIDNSTKAILDALQASGVIEDDKYVEELKIKKIPQKRRQRGAIKVDVETMEGIA